jgi:NTP pyrophosphatase (non-canonical NTP hydrolase)
MPELRMTAEDQAEISSAIAALTQRALATRERFADYERRTVGHEWGLSELVAGFVVDVGDLTRLVMAEQGHRVVPDHRERLAHELADCLWSVLVLSQNLGVDLGAAFVATLDELDAFLEQQSPS